MNYRDNMNWLAVMILCGLPKQQDHLFSLIDEAPGWNSLLQIISSQLASLDNLIIYDDISYFKINIILPGMCSIKEKTQCVA